MRARGIRRSVTALALVMAAAALVPVLLDAILVAPHAIFIDHRTRAGQMFLVNTGTVAEEVSVELKFGYPDSDSSGGAYVRLIDEPDSSMPSAAGWVRAFPRRTIVAPGERQTVRLLAQPPLNLADGEYWARLIVTSHEIRPAPAGNDTVVRAGVDVQLRTILSLTYRKGALQTGVAMRGYEPHITRDSLTAWVGLERRGNAAFLGSVDLEVHDQTGRTVGTWTTPVAVFYQVRRRFAFPLDAPLPAGTYTVQIHVSTHRDDLRQADVLPAAPLTDSSRVDVR